jgi:hypothetical protein
LGASANVQSRVTDKLLNLTDLPVTTPPANFFQIDEDDTAILAKAGIATTDIINVTFVAYTASIQLNLTKEESESIDDASIIQLGLNTFLTVSEVSIGYNPISPFRTIILINTLPSNSI